MNLQRERELDQEITVIGWNLVTVDEIINTLPRDDSEKLAHFIDRRRWLTERRAALNAELSALMRAR